MTATDRPRCETCLCFEARQLDDAAAARALAAGVEIPPGVCRRYPQPLRKLPHEWCAEYRGKEQTAGQPAGKAE